MGCNNCNSCGQSPCECLQASNPGCNTPCGSPVPQPFYAVGCEQQHCNPQLVPAYAGVKVTDSFNMPACGQSASVTVPNLLGLPVGSYLWNVGVGYLKVVAVNLLDNTVTLQNDCTAGNIAPGSTVAACTNFVVTPTPPTSGAGPGQTGVFVAIDFTAPNNGSCIIITVTSVNGLSVGKNVSIGSGVYRVQSIPSATLLEICNDGAGITPGSPVIAKNGSGQYQYPITLIDTNACTNTAVEEGKLVVCKDNIQQPLLATAAGQIPVAQDTEGNVKMMTLDVPTRTCTTILCCLVLVPGTLSYTITVSDTSEFFVGDVAQIGTRSDRWTITAIIDGTHLQATTDTNPPAVTTIAVATSFCIIDCCEDLQLQVNELVCAAQVIFGDIPQLGPSIQAITLTPDGNGGGDFGTVLSSNVKTIALPLLLLGCPPTMQVTVIAHLSVATLNTWEPQTFVVAGGAFPAPLAWYEEIGFAWDIGTFPAGARAGKLVRTHTIQDGKIGGFPLVTYPGALFNQVASPAADYPMDYIQADVEIAAVVTAADTITLSMSHLAVLGGQYAANLANPLDLGELRYLVTGWVEIFRSA